MSATKAILTEREALEVNGLMPGNANVRLGERIRELQQKGMAIQKVEVTADASGGTNFVVEYSGELMDAWVVCTASNTSGTLGIRRSTTALTTLMTCAVVDVVNRTALLLQSGKTLTQGEILNVKANGAGDRGIVYMAVLRS